MPRAPRGRASGQQRAAPALQPLDEELSLLWRVSPGALVTSETPS